MSFLSAHFFSFLQATPFYVALHRDAVALLPPGSGKRWLDVGCGPGLVARLAQERGYEARGVDIDPSMVRRANALAKRHGSAATFEVRSVEDLGSCGQVYDVVSAASLVVLMADRRRSIGELLSVVKPGGSLLLIEPAERMAGYAVTAGALPAFTPRDRWVLARWTGTRTPGRAVSEADTAIEGMRTTRYELLGGLVNAWRIRVEGLPGTPR